MNKFRKMKKCQKFYIFVTKIQFLLYDKLLADKFMTLLLSLLCARLYRAMGQKCFHKTYEFLFYISDGKRTLLYIS
jgi:hypothetical protein